MILKINLKGYVVRLVAKLFLAVINEVSKSHNYAIASVENAFYSNFSRLVALLMIEWKCIVQSPKMVLFSDA